MGPKATDTPAKPKEESKSSFSFGQPKSPDTSKPSIFGSASKTSGFAGLSSNTGTGFAFGNAAATTRPSWATEPVAAFGTSKSPQAFAAKEKAEEYDPQYDALVTLDEVVTQTGEEDEKIYHQIRCKLFRFVDAQWKERGVGDIKIMQSKSDIKQFRIIMRRDQVQKLCANHKLQGGMELTPQYGSDRAYTWFAYDCSDPDEPKNEKLCAKFRNKEAALEFKDKFTAAI